jgi:hypothetical protein
MSSEVRQLYAEGSPALFMRSQTYWDVSLQRGLSQHPFVDAIKSI